MSINIRVMFYCIYWEKLYIRVCLLTILKLKSPLYFYFLSEWLGRIILLQWPGTLRKLEDKLLTNII